MHVDLFDYSSSGLANDSFNWLTNSSGANMTDFNKSCVFNVSESEPIVDDFSIGFKVVVGLLYTLLGFFGIVGNISILVVLCKNGREKLDNTTNLCLLNVAVIDLFYFFVCHPFIMWNLLGEGTWRTDNVTCQINGCLNCMVYLIGCYSLSLIALERQLNITYPARPRMLTHRRVKVFIACIWLFSIFCAVVPLFGFNKYVVYRNPLVCGPGLDYSTWQVLIMTGEQGVTLKSS
ncbi:alpha-1A adrenergic receptor-like [Corticium candelabrum]|uniref:alpha-1A adrenergic receptor-like n=1 Tax=Corticium candelabrum TaxID=121492 RepID=UPI002E25EB56|nr:alpha-1A adrenergic receptor-like [Corticium candelabrum]